MKCNLIKIYKEKQHEVLSSINPKRFDLVLPVILALFCISAPLAVVINLFIFIDYLKLLVYLFVSTL